MFRYPHFHEPCAAPPDTRSGDAPGVLPFAGLLLLPGFQSVSAPLSPLAVGWASTSICFYRGTDRLIFIKEAQRSAASPLQRVTYAAGGGRTIADPFTVALLRFASAQEPVTCIRGGRVGLGRLRVSGSSVAGCRRGIHRSGDATGGVPGGWTGRFSAAAAGSFQTAAVPRGNRPRRLELAPVRASHASDRPARAPLLRFSSPSAPAHRAALSGGAIHPDDPASALGSTGRRMGRVHLVRPDQPALAVFRCSSAPVSMIRAPMSLAAGHAPRPFYPRCSATRTSASLARLRRNRSPATLLGFCPSQVCSCSRDFRAFPLLFPHLPLGGLPPRSVFIEGPTV
jgi:hypothetical protein